MTYKAASLDVNVPILNAIMPSNENQVQCGLNLIMNKGGKKIGILGFSFKAGTDDLRESPLVEIIERLLGKGYDIKLYDQNVNIASLIGANRDYILNQIPHVSNLMVQSIDEIVAHADTIVIGNAAEEFKDIASRINENQMVVDLVRISERISGDGYEGICW